MAGFRIKSFDNDTLCKNSIELKAWLAERYTGKSVSIQYLRGAHGMPATVYVDVAPRRDGDRELRRARPGGFRRTGRTRHQPRLTCPRGAWRNRALSIPLPRSVQGQSPPGIRYTPVRPLI